MHQKIIFGIDPSTHRDFAECPAASFRGHVSVYNTDPREVERNASYRKDSKIHDWYEKLP
jgi:hypothetical protein